MFCPIITANRDSKMKELCEFILAAFWVIGIVIANGFWSTLFALIIPFWAWYLVAEAVIQ